MAEAGKWLKPGAQALHWSFRQGSDQHKTGLRCCVCLCACVYVHAVLGTKPRASDMLTPEKYSYFMSFWCTARFSVLTACENVRSLTSCFVG